MYFVVMATSNEWDRCKCVSTFDNKTDADHVVNTINKTTHIKAWIESPLHNGYMPDPVPIYQAKVENGKVECSQYLDLPFLQDKPNEDKIYQCGDKTFMLWAESKEELDRLIKEVSLKHFSINKEMI